MREDKTRARTAPHAPRPDVGPGDGLADGDVLGEVSMPYALRASLSAPRTFSAVTDGRESVAVAIAGISAAKRRLARPTPVESAAGVSATRSRASNKTLQAPGSRGR